MKKNIDFIPIQNVDFVGETVTHVFFATIAGGDKMYWLFESGKVVIMPVHRKCPVQTGLDSDLAEDFDSLLNAIEEEKKKFIVDRDSLTSFIKELKNGVDSKQSG